MQNDQKRLWEYFDLVRGSGVRGYDKMLNLLYVLHAWRTKKLKREDSFDKFYEEDITGIRLRDLFLKLGKTDRLFEIFTLQERGLLENLNSSYLIEIFNFLRNSPDLPSYSTSLACIAESDRAYSEYFVPDEISKLAIELLGRSDKKIYAPFTSSFNFACNKPEMSFFAENKVRIDLIIELLREIDKIDLTYHASDPLLEPSYVNKKASHLLETFDSAISFPPFNVKFRSKEFYKEDQFNRFEFFDGKGSSEIPFIEHMLAHVENRVVVLLPVGFLFRGGAEEGFRRFLIDRNYVETIIQFPSNLMVNTAIETALMVLNKKKKNGAVTFISMKNEPFCSKRSRKTVLTNLEDVLEIVEKRKNVVGVSCNADYENIAQNDFSFSIDRYVFDQEARNLREQIKNMPCVKLGQIAELKRSQVLPEVENGTEMLEISPSDLPEAGFVKPSGKVKKIDCDSSRFKTYRLAPADVILTTKGTIGKVGIVGDNSGFIVSQAFQIIRVKSGLDEAKYLYLFLKSTLGQSLLNQITSGSVMPQILGSDLSSLEIPWPDIEERKEMIKNFNEEIVICEKIEKLKGQLDNLRCNFLKK